MMMVIDGHRCKNYVYAYEWGKWKSEGISPERLEDSSSSLARHQKHLDFNRSLTRFFPANRQTTFLQRMLAVFYTFSSFPPNCQFWLKIA